MASQLRELNEDELIHEINYLEKTLEELESISQFYPPSEATGMYESIGSTTRKAIAIYAVELKIRKVETLLAGAK